MQGLTQILRTVARDPVESTWSLSEELQHTRRYLELEKLRFQDKFHYEIREKINSSRNYVVPKLAVIAFVENALKHGLRNKGDDRKLLIEVEEEHGSLKIRILDNGIGRRAASSVAGEATGNGMEMMEQFFNLLREFSGLRTSFEVKDLYKDNRPSGTLVEITIT